ncbi:MAG TPA: DNA mismatch repair endonuclease MutL [Syntrophomonadaceae bacterium]|nr:DNA mismatch repair endonuclease MutL [Syntrophomonadaceae bacterium]HPR93027.1 DNA mismatch repair endonuclease MutL [Syntrophomonadaceae bacterium]
MAIKLLDDDVINKIAAGEVIERPASIVKELLENSIDAKASLIKVSIKNGGTEEIIVEDNGAGIDFDELPLAFMRHATSKLKHEEDLFAISTMGFRGEALPSIASVARVEIFSKTHGADGSICVIEGGNIKKLERYPTADGTKIIVRDLFFNTPVRKTFLKSPVSEGNNIYDTVLRYALAYPEISFVFDNYKKTQFKTPGNSSLRDTVFVLYGSDINNFLIEIDETGSQYKLTGLISKPEYKRNNRRQGLFFVNKRPVRSPMLARAVDNAYRGLLVSKEFPVFFLSLTIPADSLDVNIHPQKTEVRFQDEQTVFRFVSGALKKYLDDNSYSLGNNYHSDYMRPDYHKGINEFLLQPDYIRPSATPKIFFEKPIFSRDYDQETGEVLVTAQKPANTQLVSGNQALDFKIIGQLNDSYILAENADGLLIIDQHAAHERIWYNRLTRQYKTAAVKQLLVLPLAVDFSSAQIALLENNMELLSELGFEIDIIGHNSIVIRAVPNIAAGNESAVISSILDLLKDGEAINLKDEILSSMACKKAVTAGTKLSIDEMVQLLDDLLGEENYRNCPHGRPTIININAADLQRMFKRQK